MEKSIISDIRLFRAEYSILGRLRLKAKVEVEVEVEAKGRRDKETMDQE
jgi:hypothetical protein